MERYKVQRGDSLWKIARRNGVSLEALIAANPQLDNINSINPGTKLNIPQAPAASTESAFDIVQTERESAFGNGDGNVSSCGNSDSLSCGDVCCRMKQERPFIYTADENDSIDGIAAVFDLSRAELLHCNQQLKPDEPLQAGLKIFIPGLDAALAKEQLDLLSESAASPSNGHGAGTECESYVYTCPHCGGKMRINKCGN